MDDCFVSSDLLSVDEAVGRLLAAVKPITGTETLPLTLALGRVLAEEVTARVDVPGHDNSAMDGYAVRSTDVGAGPLPVVGIAPAGSAPATLEPRTAMRIFTGAPIPHGADAVVMQEQTELRDGLVSLPNTVRPGQNVRRAGEDVRAGAVVLTPGRRLRPQDLGMAAAVGAGSLTVVRRLRVALLATGDELVAAGNPLQPGQIYDSNGPTLHALLTALGFECLPPVRLPDRRDATIAALETAAADADVIITSGGVSVGDEDHVKPAVAALGRLDLWRVAIKPGKPFAFGFVGDTPFLGLPGNPVSVFVTALLLARPFLLRRAGITDHLDPLLSQVIAGFDWPRPDHKRREYLRARLTMLNGQAVAEIYPHQGSGVLSSCAWADGLVQVEPGQVIRPGDRINYLGFADLLG